MTGAQPPRLATAFFRWFCHPDFLEEIEGDLIERFHMHRSLYGTRQAQWRYTRDVVLLFRPAVIVNIHHLIPKIMTTMTLQTKRQIGLLTVAAVLLCIPLIAMQFTNEVNWDFFDFIVAAVLLFGTAMLLGVILNRIKSRRNRILFAVVLLVFFLLVWAELAVGLFGSPFAGS